MIAQPRPPGKTPANRPANRPAKPAAKKPGGPPKKRRSPGWIPDQHGAWAMLLIPIITGTILSGPTWGHILLFASWMVGYFAFFAVALWWKSRRKARWYPPVRAYVPAAGALGLITVIVMPQLLWWTPIIAPFFAAALWRAAVRDERSLLARTVAVIPAGMMCAVAYDIGCGFAHAPGWWPWKNTSAYPDLPGISPTEGATGWVWVWLVTAIFTAYFWGTVPYVKTLVRQRGRPGWLVLSVGSHAIVTGLVGVAAVQGYIRWVHVAMWVLLTLRALAMPLLAKKRGKPWKPSEIGRSEILVTVIFLLTLFI